jgi:hypothetical protein
VGFGALALDLNNVYGSIAQLQAAADAGALEGVRNLYCDDGSLNHSGCPDGSPSATAAARAAAEANVSRGSKVEVVASELDLGHWEFLPSQPGDDPPVSGGIERGGAFTESSTATPTQTNLFYFNSSGKRKPRPFTDDDFANIDVTDLNSDDGFINAVRVTVVPENSTLSSMLAGLLGIDDFAPSATAVAYATFPDRIDVAEVDFPIAMCEEILEEGCNVTRLVPSTVETGGWTDLDVPQTCSGAVNANDLEPLVANSGLCADGGINPTSISLGDEIKVNNGQINSRFTQAYDCWKNNASLDNNDDGWPDEPVTLTMPVVEGCSFGGSCATVIGAVEVEVIWMILNEPGGSGANSLDNVAPTLMTTPQGTWSNSSTDGETRWDSFVEYFDLMIDETNEATVANGGAAQKTMYLRPLCDPVELSGSSTVNYFGNLTTVPVLVY